MESHFGHSTEHFPRPLSSVRVTDFFGHVTEVRQLRGSYPFEGLEEAEAVAAAVASSDGQQQQEVGGSCGWSLEGGEGKSGRTCSSSSSGSGGGRLHVKGRIGSEGSSREWGGTWDGLTVGGAVGLLLVVTASSIAWGACMDK
jgi:hypothetical protein